MIEIGIFAALMVIGYLFGTSREKRHFQSLIDREAKLLVKVPYRSDAGAKLATGEMHLVAGCVVVASDYFKNVAATLRNLFGGRLSSYETLLDRARREAVCRMREQALSIGAREVVGVRIETHFIDKMGVEVSAYGTAIK